MDERGDVGSWIRTACIKGLATVSAQLFANSNVLPNLHEYLPSPMYHEAVGGILKQGVERLDNVRQEAGQSFISLLRTALPSGLLGDPWRIAGEAMMKSLFLR